MSVDHYENFPVASWLCPAPLRPTVRAIYHYARCADDIADEGDARAEQRLEEMSRYRAAVEATLRGEDAHPLRPAWSSVFRDLRSAIVQHELPAQPLRDLLLAFEQDVRNPTYSDRAEVLDYCSRSADPVGRLMLALVGVQHPQALRQSDAICSALQLINFWQDLSDDLPKRRYYLPLDLMTTHGVNPLVLMAGQDTENTMNLVAACTHITWARGHFYA